MSWKQMYSSDDPNFRLMIIHGPAPKTLTARILSKIQAATHFAALIVGYVVLSLTLGKGVLQLFKVLAQ